MRIASSCPCFGRCKCACTACNGNRCKDGTRALAYFLGLLRAVTRANLLTVFRAVDWEAMELSLVPIGADPGAGVRSSAKQALCEFVPSPMRNTAMQNTGASAGHADPEVGTSEWSDLITTLGRVGRIAPAAVSEMVERRLSITEARREILGRMAEASAPEISNYIIPVVGQADSASLMAEALAYRYGGPAPSDAARQFSGMRIADFARQLVEARGISTRMLSANGIIMRALHSTSDFPNLLLGTGNRLLRQGYASYDGGAKRIARFATSPDFRAKTRLQLSEAPGFVKVNEGGEFKYGTMSEAKEVYSLATYGRILGISRQALVNDDLGAFADLSIRFGRAAAEFEAQQIVNLLTSNPTMDDGVTVFHATHGNLAGSGGAINVTTLGAAKLAMRTQKGLDKTTPIDATPKFLVVPAALETVAMQYLAQLQAAQASNVNPFSGNLELVVDPRLDAVSATAWYIAADPGRIDTIEYSYLESEQGPQIDMRQGFEVDGLEMKVRLDFGAGVLDYRGLYKNVGA